MNPTELGPVSTVMSLLEARLGLCPEVFGRAVVERALKRIAQKDFSATLPAFSGKLASGDYAAWRDVIEQVMVAETWFLRYPQAFACLTQYACSGIWTPQKPLRILSFPCATGEEPYSIGVTLLEAGLDPEQIRIDAFDVCQHSVQRAKCGIFTSNSLRESGSEAILKYATKTSSSFRLSAKVRSLVQFGELNILDDALRQWPHSYDAIFCRNLLIYLTAKARDQIIKDLRLALRDDGLLFVGNAELDLFARAGFSRVSHAHAFVCRKAWVRRRIATPDFRFAAPASGEEIFRSLCVPGGDEDHMKSAPSLIAARQLADRGLLEESARMCGLLLEEDALNSRVHFLLGEISEAAGREEESQKHFDRALYLDPQHYESLMHMSLACARKGDKERSQSFFERARREDQKIRQEARQWKPS
jgi:chemotaxis protein methyltransferase WspC